MEQTDRKPPRHVRRRTNQLTTLKKRMDGAQTDGDLLQAAVDYLRGCLGDADLVQAKTATKHVVTYVIRVGDSLAERQYETAVLGGAA